MLTLFLIKLGIMIWGSFQLKRKQRNQKIQIISDIEKVE